MSDTLLETAPVVAAPTLVPAVVTGTPPPPASWVKPDGGFENGWLDKLPAEFADRKDALSKFKSVPELLKSYGELEKFVGKKNDGMVRIPGALKEGATPQEKTAWDTELASYRKAVGVPEKAEDYKLKPETLPEGVFWDDKVSAQFAKIAHDNNIPPAAMQQLVNEQIAVEQARMTEAGVMMKAEMDKGVSALKDAWKGNYDVNIQASLRVAKTIGLDPNSPGLRDPNVVMALQKMGALLSEDKLVKGDVVSASSNPGRDKANVIITGKTSDGELLRLHKSYMEGDKTVNKMVIDMLATG